MLEYDRNDRSKRIHVNNTDGSNQCIICNYWYFLEIKFRFQPEVSNSCHGFMQNAMSFIIFVDGNGCIIHFLYMSKHKATNFLIKC